MNSGENIAIDGPAGAGKSTVARMLAKKLGYLYIDTGAMYRALTFKALELGVPLEDEVGLSNLARETNIVLKNKSPDSLPRVFCDGRDVTKQIRKPLVSRYVSTVAGVPGVRMRMAELQRSMSADGGVVMDGRDIGSYVLPQAKYKFFITASPLERARRRYQELMKNGYEVEFEQVKKELEIRDRLDRERKLAPLVRHPDAYVINTDALTPAQVVQKIIEQCKGEG